MKEALDEHDVVAVAYADCGTYGALDEVLGDVPRLDGAHCYDVLAGPHAQAALEEEPGTYLLTDFLARTFEHTVLRELGLDRHPELRDAYFGHYTRVLWLAQRPTAATRAAAERAAAHLGLPLEVREVGEEALERQLAALLSLTLLHRRRRRSRPPPSRRRPRGGPLDVGAHAGGARADGGAATPPPRTSRRHAPVYGRTTGVGANRHVDVDRRPRRATRCGCCAATPAASASRCRDDVVRATVLVRLAQMAAGGGSRPEVAARARRRCWPRSACRPCATSAGSAPATSPCSPSSDWRWPARARTAARRGCRSARATRSR